MTAYLVLDASPKENLLLLANKNATTTEAYEQLSNKIIDMHLEAKAQALQITSIALIAIGALIAFLVNVSAGVIIGSLAMFTWIGSSYFSRLNDDLKPKLFTLLENRDAILEQIGTYLYQRYRAKNHFIVNQLKNEIFEYSEAKVKAVQELEIKYGTLSIPFTTVEHAERQEYLAIYQVALSILKKSCPSRLSNSAWIMLQNQCKLVVSGFASVLGGTCYVQSLPVETHSRRVKVVAAI